MRIYNLDVALEQRHRQKVIQNKISLQGNRQLISQESEQEDALSLQRYSGLEQTIQNNNTTINLSVPGDRHSSRIKNLKPYIGAGIIRHFSEHTRMLPPTPYQTGDLAARLCRVTCEFFG